MAPRIFLALLFTSLWLIAAEEDGFQPLFNGRNLDGWVNVNCAPETWGVRENLITCTGKPTGALRTVRQYENFILELEWRHLQSGGNAGVFIWASPIAAPGVPFLRAIEVQVLDNGYDAKGKNQWYTTHGDVFPIHGQTMTPIGRVSGKRSFPSEERSNSAPEWNHYRIVCQNGAIRLSVNGKQVSGGDACGWRKGYIGLESEGAPTEWRNLRIKELPPSGATAEQTAPESRGERALYNGLDLRGWTSATPARWAPSDWRLALKEGAKGEPLWLDESLEDCELIVDFRAAAKAAPEGAKPAILVRGDEGEPAVVPLDGATPGKWSRFVLKLKGGECVAQIEGGSDQQRTPIPRGQRHKIGLLDFGGAAEFANLYVRPAQ